MLTCRNFDCLPAYLQCVFRQPTHKGCQLQDQKQSTRQSEHAFTVDQCENCVYACASEWLDSGHHYALIVSPKAALNCSSLCKAKHSSHQIKHSKRCCVLGEQVVQSTRQNKLAMGLTVDWCESCNCACVSEQPGAEPASLALAYVAGHRRTVPHCSEAPTSLCVHKVAKPVGHLQKHSFISRAEHSTAQHSEPQHIKAKCWD